MDKKVLLLYLAGVLMIVVIEKKSDSLETTDEGSTIPLLCPVLPLGASTLGGGQYKE
jgi:hypothetical protein